MSTYGNPEGRIGYNELSPYVQRLLGNGIGNGSVYTERSYQKITQTMMNVKVNLNTFNKNTDSLLVFKNGLFMTLDLEYSLNADNTISPINDIWNGTEDKPIIFDFFCIGNTTGTGSGGGNPSIEFVKLNLSISDWIQENDMYYININHNLNSEYIIVSAMNSDTKQSLHETYTIVNENNIKLYNDIKINVSLAIIDVASVSPSDSGNIASGANASFALLNSTAFKYDSSLDMYKATITHNLNSQNLFIGIVDNDKKSVYPAYKAIDNNSIELYNTEQRVLNVSILSL